MISNPALTDPYFIPVMGFFRTSDMVEFCINWKPFFDSFANSMMPSTPVVAIATVYSIAFWLKNLDKFSHISGLKMAVIQDWKPEYIM